MPRQSQFFPGRPAATEHPLADYRPHQPVGAVSEYVEALTSPGDLVVDLFCQGPRFVAEAVELGRRVLGFSVNPLLLAAARMGLIRVDPQAFRAAFTALADSPQGDRPLQSHLLSLYRSACPACTAAGVAEWFAWDRDIDYPFEKAVRCRECGEVQVGPTDRDDVALARSVAPRGLAYYYALDRAAPLNHPARDRAAELVNCYTPRNLSALMALNRRLDGLRVTHAVKLALTAALIECFDRGSKLYAYGDPRRRPRTLRVPVRYLERNVWFRFEQAFQDLESDEPRISVAQEQDPRSLLRHERDGYALVARAAREVRELVSPDSAALVLVTPPRPDGVFWALSALWATWLWNSPEARAMRPFLQRRRFDWDWHWRALREALRVVGPCLTAEGSLVTLFDVDEEALLESVCLAASGAGYDLQCWGYAPETGYGLVWRWDEGQPARPLDAERLQGRMINEVKRATVQTLQNRGEPTPRPLVRAGAHTALIEKALLPSVGALDGGEAAMAFLADSIRQGLSAAPITELSGDENKGLWWLSDPPEAVDTLADRVEATVRHMLNERQVWTESDLVNGVYARFPRVLSPDLTFVHVCIESYGAYVNGQIHLRSEDDKQRRRREVEHVRENLIEMGERLGYRGVAGHVWDVRWLEDGREAYVFLVSSTAAIAAFLLHRRLSRVEAQRCLVVPGGRAGLVDLKLQRDTRLGRAVEAGGWQFIKFRHLRRLMKEDDLDRYAFKTVLGLDPIIEQEGAQIPLF